MVAEPGAQGLELLPVQVQLHLPRLEADQSGSQSTLARQTRRVMSPVSFPDPRTDEEREWLVPGGESVGRVPGGSHGA